MNTSSTAIQLRFDIKASSLSSAIKSRLLEMNDQRLTDDGVIVIKAQSARSQERNRQDALQRLYDLIAQANHRPKARIATKPSKASQQRRVESKLKRGKVKHLRGRVHDD